MPDVIQYDEGNWHSLSEEEKEKSMQAFLNSKVNKSCEACGFYAETQKDVFYHADHSRHGFSCNGFSLHIAIHKEEIQ